MQKNSKTEPPELYEIAYQVNDRQSFLKFLEALKKNFKDSPNTFENTEIDTYLDAAHAWIIDKNKYQIVNNENDFDFDKPDWKTIAFMFLAGKFYE